MKIQNPIIRGFYPDPSVCEANGKFYLACSTFQYFPGVPVFESEDLVNWKQVGNCLTRLSQIELHKVPSSGGVFAPTLRFHDGTFYMVTNNNTFGRNFYISTNDISGEWSEPIFVDQEGIDPSLLFDDDGKVYFTSNGTYNGRACIMQCEIDIKTGKKLQETRPVWPGNGGRFLESPHLYHIGEYYYMMAAEGGTEYGHMITYARGRDPFGPFETCKGNPILTNRDLGGNESFIQGIGHGDLIKDKNGNCFIVCLGFRQSAIYNQFHHLGREVCLAPVEFDADGWFSAGQNGQVYEWMEMPIETTEPAEDKYDLSFDKNDLSDLRWEYLRDYKAENYSFADGRMTLRGTGTELDDCDSPTFIGVRQSEFKTDLKVNVAVNKMNEAGVTYYMDESEHYDLFVKKENADMAYICFRTRIGDACQNRISLVIRNSAYENIGLRIKSDVENYYFYADVKPEDVKAIITMEHGSDRKTGAADAKYVGSGNNAVEVTEDGLYLGKARSKYLSTEVAGGFTGVFMGLFAVDAEGNKAVFSDLVWEQRNENPKL